MSSLPPPLDRTPVRRHLVTIAAFFLAAGSTCWAIAAGPLTHQYRGATMHERVAGRDVAQVMYLIGLVMITAAGVLIARYAWGSLVRRAEDRLLIE